MIVFTAENARRNSIGFESRQKENLIQNIMDSIQNESCYGKMELHLKHNIDSDTITTLESLGYLVVSETDVTKIFW